MASSEIRSEGEPGGGQDVGATRPRRSVVRWVVLAGVAVVVALVVSTMRGSAFVYAKYVDEIMTPAEHARWIGRTVRVEGLVVPASIRSRSGTGEYLFRVSRNGAVMPVHFRGVVPDTFRDCAGVTVQGALGSGGTFEATQVIARCPSKYESATVRNGECVIGPSGPPTTTAQR